MVSFKMLYINNRFSSAYFLMINDSFPPDKLSLSATSAPKLFINID